MFNVQKPKQKQIVVIRTATGNELSNYEKRKLANIEAKAQENVIEVIKINGKPVQVDPLNKEVNINLDDFDKTVKSADISSDDLFVIRCELSEELMENNK